VWNLVSHSEGRTKINYSASEQDGEENTKDLGGKLEKNA
jgi:hypothetical protein